MASRLILLAGAALALAACGGPQAGNDLTNGAAGNDAAPKMGNMAAAGPGPSLAPAAPAAGPIDRSLLIGRWSDAPGCQDVITEFDADGTFRVDGNPGSWALTGNQLTIRNRTGRSASYTIESVTATELLGRAPDGTGLRSYRCTTPAP